MGIILKQIDQALFVKSISPDGPADACGKIKINDILVGVNGRDVTTLQITEVPQKVNTQSTLLTLTQTRNVTYELFFFVLLAI